MSFDFKSDLFKANLKEQWLNYYESNRYWIIKLSCWERITVQSNRKIKYLQPSFILGVLSVIEPKISEIILLLNEYTDSPQSVVKVLGLDFDPEMELQKRTETERRAKIQTNKTIPIQTESDAEYLDRIRQENIT
ncbi:DUF5331 domain-containing protein [Merismopedia glauca]|uniref:DUF5331 domain-containing protein n=1 Tax=Merismopedia glauca CCAP 1448/3 TaxID=1296344 RepID=A0A2T1CA38_9CYAN|nr:DUF5331 domain-containing protein [Merismopedia glauca]PSB05111.1 hypothetical protein C7B64_00980 [Merismopedia glauca CCAP 1448/3]